MAIKKNQTYIGIGNGRVVPFELIPVPDNSDIIVRINADAVEDEVQSLFPESIRDRITFIPEVASIEIVPRLRPVDADIDTPTADGGVPSEPSDRTPTSERPPAPSRAVSPTPIMGDSTLREHMAAMNSR